MLETLWSSILPSIESPISGEMSARAAPARNPLSVWEKPIDETLSNSTPTDNAKPKRIQELSPYAHGKASRRKLAQTPGPPHPSLSPRTRLNLCARSTRPRRQTENYYEDSLLDRTGRNHRRGRAGCRFQ